MTLKSNKELIIISLWEEELKKTGKTIFFSEEIFYCKKLKAYFRKKDEIEIAKSIENLRELEEFYLMTCQERLARWENGYGKFFD